jgi:hypothetical protein
VNFLCLLFTSVFEYLCARLRQRMCWPSSTLRAADLVAHILYAGAGNRRDIG